jgi:16S rRNA (uracil1498-N3)-methyltransferase
VTLDEWPRRIAALGQFRVDDPSVAALAASDEHHLRKVLRARDGEEVVLTNGRGAWSIGVVTATGLDLVSDVHVDERGPETTLYLAPLKGDRSEWAVAKATELGVARIVPLLSERVIVKMKGDTSARVVARWRRIAAESCGQSRRTFDLVVDEPVSVGDVASDVAIADFNGSPRWRDVRAVAIGPEGGWAPGEWGADRTRVSLGPSVLRAETAGVAAATVLALANGSWGFTLQGDDNR